MSGKAISESVTPSTSPLSSIPVPCRAAAVSLRCPSGQLLTWCVGSRTSADKSLIPGSNCRPNTLFPECQRVSGGDRYNVRASVILVDAASVDEPRHTHSHTTLSVNTHFHLKFTLHPFHVFILSHTVTNTKLRLLLHAAEILVLVVGQIHVGTPLHVMATLNHTWPLHDSMLIGSLSIFGITSALFMMLL